MTNESRGNLTSRGGLLLALLAGTMSCISEETSKVAQDASSANEATADGAGEDTTVIDDSATADGAPSDDGPDAPLDSAGTDAVEDTAPDAAICALGTKRCAGDVPETCTGSAWSAGAACSGATPRCKDGACVTCEAVDATKATCGGACVDTKTDTNNCGACAKKCGSANTTTVPTCTTGTCVLSCATNFADCDGDPSNGCEANLLTDVNNCGACGYRVVAAGRTGEASQRTCIAGKPSPGWVPVSTAGAPTFAAPGVAAWTGKRFLVVAGTTYAGYDPSSNTWSTLPAPGGPLSGDYASIPHLRKVFVWGGSYGTSSAAQIFDDSGSTPKWIDVTSSGAPSSRVDTGVVYLERPSGSTTLREVYVLLGSSGPAASSGRYDLDSGTWTLFSSDTSFAQCTHSTAGSCTRSIAQFSAARGVIVGYGGGCSNGVACLSQPALLRLHPTTLAWDAAPAAGGYSNRLGPTLLPVGDRLFYGGGYNFCGAYPTPCNVRQTWFLDPLVGGSEVLYPSKPDPAVQFAFELFTGRAIFYWGGRQTSQDNLTVGVANEGAMAVVGSAGLTWSNLPTTGAPTARFGPGRGGGTANQQHAWTGSEALVWGGADASGAVSTGARYQPPVGCVCPRNSDAPVTVASPCASVDAKTIVNPACAP